MRLLMALSILALGCEPEAPAHPEPPAHVSNPVPESELAVVHFTPEAIERLGIETATVEERAVAQVRLVGGEVSVPPGRAISVAAPVGGVVRASNGGLPAPGTAVQRGDTLLRLVPLAPVDRNVRALADREVAAARAQLEAAEARAARIEQLMQEHAASDREREEAIAARDVARADLEAAQARARNVREAPLLSDVTMTVRAPDDGIIRAVSAAPGQAVAPGAPLFEIVAVDALVVRVPVYDGDLAQLTPGAAVRVRPLGREGEGAEATPAVGPPTADPAGATVDRWYALGPGARFAPGERVLVEVPMHGQERARVVPWASIVVDAQGAGWVYACAGERAFRRARIDPIRRAGDLAVFRRGPEDGQCVASVGAAEIFGSEFEPGH